MKLPIRDAYVVSALGTLSVNARLAVPKAEARRILRALPKPSLRERTVNRRRCLLLRVVVQAEGCDPLETVCVIHWGECEVWFAQDVSRAMLASGEIDLIGYTWADPGWGFRPESELNEDTRGRRGDSYRMDIVES